MWSMWEEFHIKTHTGDKPYQCIYCNKVLKSNIGHIRHLKIHTQDNPYHCRQCDKAFSQNIEFQKHIRTHTRSKPEQCSNCGKASSNVYPLTYLQKHTGEKPYLCRKCEKDFSGIQPVLHKQTQHEPITFKGIKTGNPPHWNPHWKNLEFILDQTFSLMDNIM